MWPNGRASGFGPDCEGPIPSVPEMQSISIGTSRREVRCFKKFHLNEKYGITQETISWAMTKRNPKLLDDCKRVRRLLKESGIQRSKQGPEALSFYLHKRLKSLHNKVDDAAY